MNHIYFVYKIYHTIYFNKSSLKVNIVLDNSLNGSYKQVYNVKGDSSFNNNKKYLKSLVDHY